MTSDEKDRDNKIKLDVYDPNRSSKPLFTATPGLYTLTASDGHEDTMVWPHIEHGLLMDTYISLGVPQKNAGQDVTIPLGQSAQVGGMTLTYKEMLREGEMGETGASIGALVVLSDDKNKEELRPIMSFSDQGQMVSVPAALDDNLELALVSLNAEDKSATLRVQLTIPVYPIEIYHKPMTILVWLGTAMMALSGFAAAYYRRSPVLVEADLLESKDKNRRRSPDVKPERVGETT
jgi:cytochrome c-type biogenesis protein CcmF